MGYAGAVPSDSFYARLSMSLGDAGLRIVGKLNVPLYRATRGLVGGKVGKAPVLLLTTTGRKSGLSRTTPVLYMREGERLVVVGSNAGSEHTPAWALNLASHPEAEVEVRGTRQPVRARIAAGEEKAALWQAVNERYGGFESYKQRTSREINVFVLEPR